MTPIFPSLDSPEFERGFQEGRDAILDLVRLFDQHQVTEQPVSAEINDTVVQSFEAIIERYNAVLEQIETLGTYIACFVDTNSQNTLAQAKLSEMHQATVYLAQLGTRLTAWLGALDIDQLMQRSEVARQHAFLLRQAKVQSQHLMSSAEEILASELNVSGGTAWGQLHSNLTSQIMVPLTLNGETKEYPMSEIRNFAYHPEREVRRRAYEAELAAWERSALPLAAAMNSIKHETNVLSQKRHWESPLDSTLFMNSIDRQTLDAMMTAARDSFPDFRRYLQAKARLLGLEKLAWYDISAPVGKSERVWSYDDAASFIVEQFGAFSAKLSDFAARAFREHWIDAEPRPGKVGGAYCAEIRKGESRILANYTPSYDGMSTLAHELGHGYHNLNLEHRTALQAMTPMTLAETASIFCETIVRNAALRNAGKQEQLMILEASLQNSCQVVVDITSRFLFEQGVFEKRLQRELSIEELNELMLESQRQTYGDGLDESLLHPYMWAVKGHYYSTGLPFYNYPYMFGLLFGLGLYAQYQRDPETFKRGYDELLSSTGMADAAELAQRFGIDIRSEAFWRSSLDMVRQDIDEFERLAREA
jgi:pepF/M3 family oligoendopeptidase